MYVFNSFPTPSFCLMSGKFHFVRLLSRPNPTPGPQPHAPQTRIFVILIPGTGSSGFKTQPVPEIRPGSGSVFTNRNWNRRF